MQQWNVTSWCVWYWRHSNLLCFHLNNGKSFWKSWWRAHPARRMENIYLGWICMPWNSLVSSYHDRFTLQCAHLRLVVRQARPDITAATLLMCRFCERDVYLSYACTLHNPHFRLPLFFVVHRLSNWYMFIFRENFKCTLFSWKCHT